MSFTNLFVILMFFITTLSSHDRFQGPDKDTHNRLSNTMFITMDHYDDNHADQMNPNNDEYWHSRE